LKHNTLMENDKQQPKSFLRWATTPPQSYVVYLACLLFVWLSSFYIGQMVRKKPPGMGPPSITTPVSPARN
jgi:hypothetical protein